MSWEFVGSSGVPSRREGDGGTPTIHLGYPLIFVVCDWSGGASVACRWFGSAFLGGSGASCQRITIATWRPPTVTPAEGLLVARCNGVA